MKKTLSCVFIILLFMMLPMRSANATSQAWVVIDADTARILAGQNEHTRLPIASLTKIWTALTFLETAEATDRLQISPMAASQEGSSLYLQSGEKIDGLSLLYGLMLRSGNDAAYALAEHAGGSVDGFVQLMNEKATYAGLTRTTFTNPSGLHDEAHLSTAYDTALMLYYAMQNEQFKEIATATSYVARNDEQVRSWKNKHRLLHEKGNAIAGKTGFTKTAGRTLATYFEQDDKRLIVVTLNDGNDWNTHRDLAASTFDQYDQVVVAEQGTYAILPGITTKLQEPIKLLLHEDELPLVSHVVQIPRGTKKEKEGLWTVRLDHRPLISQAILLQE